MPSHKRPKQGAKKVLSAPETIYNFRIGLDFGTTMTKASFIRHEMGTAAQHLDVQDVHWRESCRSDLETREVPSAALYCADSTCRIRSFGYDAIRDSDSLCVCGSKRILITRFKPAKGYHPGQWPLQQDMDLLIQEGIVSKEQDVIVDFLAWALIRIKEKLELNHGLTSESHITFRICCPVAWEQLDQSLLKRNVTAAAILAQMGRTKSVLFGSPVPRNGGPGIKITECEELEDVQMITEPEAAAISLVCRLPEQDLVENLRGLTIIMFDAGGGTADIETYAISADAEPRLVAQVCLPSGGSCGAQMLNDRFDSLAKRVLSNDPGLRRQALSLGVDVTTIAADYMPSLREQFQDYWKADFDPETTIECNFSVPGLWRSSDTNHPYDGQSGITRNNQLTITRQDMMEHVFRPWYESIAHLLREQIGRAQDDHPGTSYIFPYGGGTSQSGFQNFLEAHVLHVSSVCFARKLEFKRPRGRSSNLTLVSSGAAISTIDYLLPRLMARNSYGILQHLPVGSDESFGLTEEEAAKRGKVVSGEFDKGEKLLKQTINYFMKAGEIYDPNHVFDPLISVHDFVAAERTWIAEEVLVFKDGRGSDGHPANHPINAGHRLSYVLQNNLKKYQKQAFNHGKVYTSKKKHGAWISNRYDVRIALKPFLKGTQLFISFSIHDISDGKNDNELPPFIQYDMDASMVFPIKTYETNPAPRSTNDSDDGTSPITALGELPPSTGTTPQPPRRTDKNNRCGRGFARLNPPTTTDTSVVDASRLVARPTRGPTLDRSRSETVAGPSYFRPINYRDPARQPPEGTSGTPELGARRPSKSPASQKKRKRGKEKVRTALDENISPVRNVSPYARIYANASSSRLRLWHEEGVGYRGERHSSAASGSLYGSP